MQYKYSMKWGRHMVLQDYFEGKSFDTYEFFGVHKKENGFTFRTFAPNAAKVCVYGDFNGWQEAELRQEGQSGVYTLDGVQAEYGMYYKFLIYTGEGERMEHCDPYSFAMELRPKFASIITDLHQYTFQDKEWMDARSVSADGPVHIYELHMGSWRKKADRPEKSEESQAEEGNDWYTYEEIAEPLIAYLKENYYTHIEVMPLSEHPFDGSWGYQNTGFFAPTSRYGTPDQLKFLIDKCHQAGIGVLMDFVPVHFAVDAYGLREFDGTALYEYPNSAVGESEWGSCNFIHSRREVRCFLQSAANYWLKEFHIDGLRIDAVSRLIYWQGDEGRGVNADAIVFLKNMNQGLKERFPTAMLVAEDSTTYPGVTKPVKEGGLGFDYKWDLGWMHDTLEYFQTSPEYRSRDYHKLTFSMMYFYSERFLLELSHDEVVHGKATILQKMYGDYDGKFPQARAFYMYMMAHPGKKLNFMGNELGQLREWDEHREQDWDILKFPIHDAFHRYIMELNRIYAENPAFHSDYETEGFQWLDCHQEEKCIYAILRKNTSNEKQMAAVLFNFSDQKAEGYEVEIPKADNWKIALHTDWEKYGGSGKEGKEEFAYEKPAAGEKTGKIKIDLPPYSGVLLEAVTSSSLIG